MKENEKKVVTCFCAEKPLIIAELGTSHNGDIQKAKKMISAAAETGAACVKFQIVYADEILHPNTGEVSLPGGKIKLYDKFKALESPPEFYAELKEYTESKGLLFLCTPFGMKSASILKSLKPKMVKIASPELNYTALLKETASWGLPILLSTGVSRLSDIETALEAYVGSGESGVGSRGCCLKAQIDTNTLYPQTTLPTPHSLLPTPHSLLPTPYVCLLHCVTSYPAPETDYNLRLLPNLSSVFGVPVGVSDHSADPVLVPAIAVSMGAVAVEKHFCLSKNDPGLDDPIALEPLDFSKMVKAINRAVERGKEETIACYSREKGSNLIERILGNGIKELAASERANYRLTNRSIHALRDIAAGEVLKRSDYAVLRTEKILRPGLEPCYEKTLEGRIARNAIPAGEGIRFEDV